VNDVAVGALLKCFAPLSVDCVLLYNTYSVTRADPGSKIRGAISVVFGIQASLRVHYCKINEVYFTTLLWQSNGQQNGLTSQMLFSESYKIIVNQVTFVGFMGGNRPARPSWLRPCSVMRYD